MRITYSSICETGRVRKINQDAIFSFCTDAWGIFCVADGMGGHDEGERASHEVVHSLMAWTQQDLQLENYETPDIVRQVKKVLSESNEKIRRETADGKLCGCTVVILILIREECILLTAGDSRCYELQGGSSQEKLVQLTTDDVVGGNGPQKNRLTNAVGVKSPMICRVRVLPFLGEHTFLMCTDGVYKYCNDRQLLSATVQANWENTDGVLRKLQECIEANGAGDNYSAFLIRACGSDTDTGKMQDFQETSVL